MQVLFFRTLWGMDSIPLGESLDQIKQEGYDGFEYIVHFAPEAAEEAGKRGKDLGLRVIAMISTRGKTPEEHIKCLREQAALAIKAEPYCIVSHTGRDFFSFDDS